MPYRQPSDPASGRPGRPRCKARDIGEIGALHKVLRPTRVTAHDRRDDARIRDDQDDRRRRYYETVAAVDIDPEDIAEGSWRHAKAVFGVDFTRRALVRRFNLGTTRYDRPATDQFAGEDVRLNPFHTCPTCGGTTVDGPPPAAPSNGLIAPSIWDPARKHHRPWCTYRRSANDTDYLRLLLAHELETEALRILLPVVTLQVEERAASFQAALMAGVARKYGGDPDHLAVVTATMPDQETGHRRRFLVLHDTLPGGTGYLHRLSTADGFREVLEAAREVVENCRCQGEPGKRACHRCLLSHVPGSMYDKVSRIEALDMLNELLIEWAVADVPTTGDISLWDQVESELEARFLGGLEMWAHRTDTPGTLASGEVINGKKTRDLRIEGPDGSVRHWRMLLQNTIRGTRPDVLFRLVGDDEQEVSLYLDGYEYHASRSHNRLADDAHKRARLRAHRGLVFQFTWQNIDDWEKRNFGPGNPREPLFTPYQGNAQNAARGMYQRTGRDTDELVTTMWTNPIETLLAYLTDPDPQLWLTRAEAVVAGAVPAAVKSRSDASGATDRVIAALRGDPLPPNMNGKITVCGADALTIVLDQRNGAAWSGFAVIDDRDEAIRADEDAHKHRWANWLYWGNLLQFLDAGAGDSAQLALSELDEFDPSQLTAAGGDGYLSMQSLAPLDDDLIDETLPPPRRRDATPELRSTAEGIAAEWQSALDLLDPDEPGLAELAHELAVLGAPAPQVGYELGDHAWQAEMAWSAAKVAVVLAGNDDEARRRDTAYADQGWTVRPASSWTAPELAERIGGQS